jgi:DNA topoisomerase-1
LSTRLKKIPLAPTDPLESAKFAGLRYVTGEGPGIVRRRAGKGFSYVDVDSKPVRDKATLKRIASLVIPPAWENVWICPVANGHIQAVGRDAKGRKQYRYHPRYREVRDEAKYGRMLAFGAVLPKIRKKVNEDLGAPGLPQRKVIAAVVRLLDETCIRVGNDEYAKSNKSYGLTTLKEQHVDVHGDNVRLRFRGKSKQDHDIKLRDRRLARIVKELQELPGQELFQYQQEDGDYVKVDSADVNDYLREITEDDFTAKDFRTWHGTGQMVQELAALGPAQSETEAKRNIVEAVKITSKRLGNRPAACRKYYIHPAILESYIGQSMFEAMKGVHAGSADSSAAQLRPEERVVLRLVQAYAGASADRTAKAS